jgi:hypothetical protein
MNSSLTFILKCIFILLFATFVDVITVESIGFVVEDVFNIPDTEMMNLMYWGDVFIARIIASISGTFVGAYIIGSYLDKKQKVVTLIYILPIIAFWALGVFAYIHIVGLPHNINNPDFPRLRLFLPIVTLILTPLFAYLGCYYGSKINIKNTGGYSVLKIKWYNFFWFIPIFYSMAVAIVYMLCFSIAYSIWLGENPLSGNNNFLFDFITNFTDNLFIVDFSLLLILSLMLISTVSIITFTYNCLSNEVSEVRNKSLKIFGGTVYIYSLFILLFNLPEIFSFSFKTNTIITNQIGSIPNNITEVINFSVIFISGYISERTMFSLLKRNTTINNFFKKIKKCYMVVIKSISKGLKD